MKRELDRKHYPETSALATLPSSKTQMAEDFQKRRTRISLRRSALSLRLAAWSETLAVLHGKIDEG